HCRTQNRDQRQGVSRHARGQDRPLQVGAVDREPRHARDAGALSFFQRGVRRLMDFVRAEAKFDLPSGTTTYRRQLELSAAARRPSARAIKELREAPQCPPAFEDVWGYYTELRSAPTLGMSGVNPISWEQLHAWSSMTGRRLMRYELELVLAID